MAQFKARMPVVAKRTEEGEKVSFSTGLKVGKMISVGVTPSQSNVTLYGDDDIAEEDNSVTNAAVSLNTSHIPSKVSALIFGATHKEATDTTEEEVIYKDGDEAPYVGFGFVDGHKISGEKKFRVVWLPRVKFSLPAETSNTRGETTAFSTPSISGTAKVDPITGEWKHDYFYPTAAEAVAKLKELAGIVEETAAATETTENTNS